MAKKSATARRSAQRSKATRAKGFELVQPAVEEREEESPLLEVEEEEIVTSEPDIENVAPSVVEEKASTPVTVAPEQGSARARLAARRQAKNRSQRAAPQLITVEHFAYVKRDLITIGILATLLFVVIIVLYFAYGSVL